jgi:hypothetical protein
MPLYSFVHLCRDGREKRLLQAELPSDAAAMRHAGELSTTGSSGARLTVSKESGASLTSLAAARPGISPT